jgi:hypothetical protein
MGAGKVVRRVGVWGAIALALAVVAVFQGASDPPPALASHLCGGTGSPRGPFNLQTYESADWRNAYNRTFALAGLNRLFPDIGEFALPRLETGNRAAGSTQTTTPYIPPTMLKAIAWIESAWAQADPSVPYGAVGPALVSHDCGYGLMQVTTGMQNVSGVPTAGQAAIGGHYAFNIAAGARILAEKWNAAPEFRPIVGSRNRTVVEDWYYALWSYNGFSFKNHPQNPALPLPRAAYLCNGSQPRSNYPYQELVLGCMAHPPNVGGTPLWDPVPVTLPNLSQPAFSLANWDACSLSHNCAAMDIATPNPSHTDPATTNLTREQVIGAPRLGISTGQISLVTIPPVVNTPSSLGIVNTGTGHLSWRISSSASWLRPATQGVALGTNLGSKASSVAIVANPQGLAPGKYTATLTVDTLWGAGSPARVTVTLFNYPDGTLLRGSTGGVYVIQGGLKRGIPSAATLEALGFDWADVLTIPDSVLGSLPSGQPLLNVLANGNLLRGTDGKVYVMQGGAKRHITSSAALSACGYGWDAVRTIPDFRLNGIPTGGALSGPPCPHLLPADGTLVRGTGPEVYVMQGGLKRHIPSLATFAGMGLLWGNVNIVPNSSLNSIPTGDALLDFLANGNLLRGTGPEVYVMQGGAKRHITSSAALSACGYGWDAVRIIPDASLNAIPTGSALSGPPCPLFVPPSGAIVRSGGPEIYVMRVGLKRHIPNLATFEASGLLWGNVNVIADSALNTIPTGDALLDALADGNLLRGTGPEVYAMEGGARRHVTSPTALSGCGYGWDAVRVIPNVFLNAIATGIPLSGPPCPHVLPPDGALVRGSGPEVYVMEGGLKRHVPDLATFAGMGFLWGNVNLLPDSVLSAIPSGESLLAVVAEGSFFQGSGAQVYAFNVAPAPGLPHRVRSGRI